MIPQFHLHKVENGNIGNNIKSNHKKRHLKRFGVIFFQNVFK